MFQLERLKEAGTTLMHIWDEMCKGYIDDEYELIQEAVYLQTDINRIVWKLNSILFDAEPEEPDYPQKWIPITLRTATDEEYRDFAELYDVGYVPREEFKIYDCRMPEDGQEVLITTRWGTVEKDTWYFDMEGSSFENNSDLEDVLAWMPLPEAYKKEDE